MSELFGPAKMASDEERSSTAASVKRERTFLVYSEDRLKALWLEAVRLVCLHGGGRAALRRLNDIAAEMRLRGMSSPEYHLLNDDDREALLQRVELASDPSEGWELRKQIAEFAAIHGRSAKKGQDPSDQS